MCMTIITQVGIENIRRILANVSVFLSTIRSVYQQFGVFVINSECLSTLIYVCQYLSLFVSTSVYLTTIQSVCQQVKSVFQQFRAFVTIQCVCQQFTLFVNNSEFL